MGTNRKVFVETAEYKLAAMDFSLAPNQLIRTELGLSQSAILRYRQSKQYQEFLQELRAEWKETMLRTPGTSDIRKTISWAMSVAVKKVLHILANPRTSNKDLIAAARLTAQIDGRFLNTDTAPAGKVEEEVNSLAEELLKHINKGKDTVQ